MTAPDTDTESVERMAIRLDSDSVMGLPARMDVAALLRALCTERDALSAQLVISRAGAEIDADLLLDAYKAVLVLHRILDKQGLEMGVKAANEIADRIVKAHPEFPGMTALRAKEVR